MVSFRFAKTGSCNLLTPHAVLGGLQRVGRPRALWIKGVRADVVAGERGLAGHIQVHGPAMAALGAKNHGVLFGKPQLSWGKCIVQFCL